MKKILTIALVAVLAATSLFAGVNFSGRFRQGYTFTFADGQDPASAAWKTNEAKFVIKATDDDGIWTVGLKNYGPLDSNDKWAANASVSLTKALAKAGVDMGDFGLAISLGNNSKMTALSAYNDPTGNEYFKLKNNGNESIQFAANYGSLVKFNVAFDPTNDGGSTVASALIAPVDGISVGAGYTYNGYFNDSFAPVDAEGSSLGFAGKNMVGVSALVDVAKLADLDFKLAVSAYDNILLEKDANVNSFAANVSTGVDMVDGFVEFVMNNQKDNNKFGLNTCINFNLVDNLALDAYFNIGDFSDVSKSYNIGADASHDLAGVTFALNADYAASDKAFSVTPKMIIVF